MALFRKRNDPLDARSRALSEEIKRLEREIRDIGRRAAPPAEATLPPNPTHPLSEPPTSGSRPASASPTRGSPMPTLGARDPSPRTLPKEPRTPRSPLSGVNADPLASPAGARKFDLPAAWRRWSARFAGRNPDDRRMAHYLAAGSFQGLRPLRYEKRIARNRFIGLFVLLVVVLTGLARIYVVNLK